MDITTDAHFLGLAAELARAGIGSPATPRPPIALSALPPVVRRYLAFMHVSGEVRDAYVAIEWSGRFRLRPRGRWMRFEAVQYDACAEAARLWKMRLRYAGVPIVARDTYVRGHGRMVGRVFDRFGIVDAGGPELDAGELVTFVNDAILVAPSMLLDERTDFRAVDDDAFDVTFTDGGRSVCARVRVDADGAVRDFSTTDRFVQDPYRRGHPFVRARWSTPIGGWRTVHGRRLPVRGQAVWHLPQGDFVYAEMWPKLDHLVFDSRPASGFGARGAAAQA